MTRLLLIDDDPFLIGEQLRVTFPAPNFELLTATDGASGIALVTRQRPDVVLLDLRLPDGSGLEIYEQIRAVDARIPVIFISMAKTADTAIEAMKKGAFDYLYKPVDLKQLKRVVCDALDVAKTLRSPVALAHVSPDSESSHPLFGAAPAMLDIYKAIGRVAAQDVTVLITGESGTGKEVVARAIYQHSARANAPFLALNCAAIPAELLESELFGHEKGAFTGADRRRIGKFEQAHGGTLLLDEIGDMPLALQAKILRVLQERTFERVGGNETIHTDVRLIASTHRDLNARAAEEKFRSDLYYRLRVFTIHLPPLRERGDDLAMLAQHFVRQFARDLGRDVWDIAPAAMERLRAYSWPGNVRELQSVVKQALLNATGAVLLPNFLPDLGTRAPAVPTATRSGFDLDEFIRRELSPQSSDLYAEAHRHVDRLLLAATLRFTGGNHRDAARLLGISRETLRSRVRLLGLQVRRQVGFDETEELLEAKN